MNRLHDRLVDAVATLPTTGRDDVATFLRERGIRGVQVAASSCPVARYLSARTGCRVVVSPAFAVVHRRFRTAEIPLPLSTASFVVAFDTDEYPDLIASDL